MAMLRPRTDGITGATKAPARGRRERRAAVFMSVGGLEGQTHTDQHR
jgi:hypothetical protein